MGERMFREVCFAAAGAALLATPAAAIAAGKEEKKIMRQITECAYVINMAEQNGVNLKHGSVTWNDLASRSRQQLGLDATPYVAEARAKYTKRARVMGADEALRHMVKRARDCNAQL